MKKLTLFLMLITVPAWGADVTVLWDEPGPELPDIFVRVYYGESSCVVEGATCYTVEAAPGVNELRLNNLPKKTILYFAAKAVNPDAAAPYNESDFSEQVIFVDVRNISITITVEPIN